MAHSTGRWLAGLYYKAGRHTYYISQIFHLIIKFCVEKKVLVIVCVQLKSTKINILVT